MEGAVESQNPGNHEQSQPPCTVSQPQTIARLAVAGHDIQCFTVAADGIDVVVTGSDLGEVIAWNFKSEKIIWRRKVHTAPVNSVAVCDELVISAWMGRAVLWQSA